MSQEYIAALALIIVNILGSFNIHIGNEVVSNTLQGLIAIWIAVRRYQKGDITLAGTRKA